MLETIQHIFDVSGPFLFVGAGYLAFIMGLCCFLSINPPNDDDFY